MRPSVTVLRALLRRNFGLAFTVLALALLVRAAIPQGWMPEIGHGSISIKLCTATGPVEMPMAGGHHHHQKQHTPDHERGQQPCAFGGLAHASAPPEATMTLPLPAQVAEQYVGTHAPFILAQAARQLPPARAPPAYV